MLNIAVRAARSAGELILRSTDSVSRLTVDQKGKNDYASEVDRMAEREIISIIKAAYPEHAILAEESGKHKGNDFVWIIDPLDGTKEFLDKTDEFAINLALVHNGQSILGFIYLPVFKEMYYAVKDEGAFEINNGVKTQISVSKFNLTTVFS